MIIIIGAIVVCICVFGGFVIGGGHLAVLIHPNELLIIGGGAAGALLIMSPIKVLKEIIGGMKLCLKGAPHNRAAYEELLKVLYELFMLGRRSGMIALEEHVLEPEKSSIFKKYPSFMENHHAVEFLCEFDEFPATLQIEPFGEISGCDFPDSVAERAERQHDAAILHDSDQNRA